MTLFSQIAFSVMQSAIFRNRQCLLAYVNRRNHMLMQMRWNLGAVIPEDTRYCLKSCSPVVLCQQVPAFLLFDPSLCPSDRSSPLTSSRFSLNTIACYQSTSRAQGSISQLTFPPLLHCWCGCAVCRTILPYSRNGAAASQSAKTCS